MEFRNTNDTFDNNIWPESTKVIDYLNQVRMRAIEDLKKAQEDSLEYYKSNSSHFKSQLTDKNSIDELRSELLAEKMYFQVNRQNYYGVSISSHSQQTFNNIY